MGSVWMVSVTAIEVGKENRAMLKILGVMRNVTVTERLATDNVCVILDGQEGLAHKQIRSFL